MKFALIRLDKLNFRRNSYRIEINLAPEGKIEDVFNLIKKKIKSL